MKQTVKANRHDFRPNSLPWPLRGDFELILRLDLTPSCWYDVNTAPCKNAWNKAGGLGEYISANNHNATLLAWRPAPEKHVFEVALYLNDSKGGWTATAPLALTTADTAVVIFSREKNLLQAELEIHPAEGPVFKSRNFTSQELRGWLRKREAWFGGPCPAPWEMELWAGWAKFNG
jgi:hypothetical protein